MLQTCEHYLPYAGANLKRNIKLRDVSTNRGDLISLAQQLLEMAKIGIFTRLAGCMTLEELMDLTSLSCWIEL